MLTGSLGKENTWREKEVTILTVQSSEVWKSRVLCQVTMQEEIGGREQMPGGLLLVLHRDLPGVIQMIQDLPRKVQEKEEMLLLASCSQKRFQTEPWTAQKKKPNIHTQRRHVFCNSDPKESAFAQAV